MVTLTNEIQIMLSFLRIFKFNTVMYYPFIIIFKNIIIFILCVKTKKKKKQIMKTTYGCFEKGHGTQ